MSPILVDTHALVFRFLEPKRLSRAAALHFKNTRQTFRVSVMSLLEIMFLNEIGRIEVRTEEISAWIREQDGWEIVPFDASILSHSRHVNTRDPFDRVLVATALTHGWRLLTRDEWMHEAYPKLAVW